MGNVFTLRVVLLSLIYASLSKLFGLALKRLGVKLGDLGSFPWGIMVRVV